MKGKNRIADNSKTMNNANIKILGASLAGILLLTGASFAVRSAQAAQNYVAINSDISAMTGSATSVIGSDATLRAVINAGGRKTNYWFEYGTDPSDATTSPGFAATEKAAAGRGITPMEFATDVSGLAPNTQYYFRVAIENASSTIRGGVATFSTR